jgi:hypothetical protein
MPIPNNTYPPLFDGQPIFGDLSSFAITPLIQGRAIDVDDFLGLTPGTTKYGADPSGGQLYGITGALISSSVAGVEALQAALLSYAGPCCQLGYPTGLAWPGNWQTWPTCFFEPAEFIPSLSGIQPARGNQYSLSYSLVVRRVQ